MQGKLEKNNTKLPNTGFKPAATSTPSSPSNSPVYNSNEKINPHLLISSPKNDKNISNESKQVQVSKNEMLDSQSILKHPLVIKTLIETYKVTRLDELDIYNANTNDINNKAKLNETINSNKYFYMCSTCGYRGNTVRGVKQHGKQLHLINKEHFGIINATEKQPLLVYYSLNDNDLNLNASNKKSMPSSLTVLPQKLLKTNGSSHLSTKDEDSHDDSEEEEIDYTNKSTEENNSFKILKNLNTSALPKDDFVIQQPVSKKARLLEAHQKYQDLQPSSLNSANKTASSLSTENSSPLLKIDRSQTYCFKCNIQFQQVSNFLAHKTNYCKDN